MSGTGSTDRGLTSVIGNVLLVAVVVVIAITVAGLSFAFLENTGTPTPDAAFEYEQTPAGLELVPQALGTDVTVQLNGKAIATIDADSAGQSVLVPTAPGDRVTVVSRDGERALLVDKQVDDRSEIGDLVAYYTFEDSDTNDTLEDNSGNGNDGRVVGDPTWQGGSLRFDGVDDAVTVDGLDAAVSVSELTVAVSYRPEAEGDQELLEHIDKQSGTNLVLELKRGSPTTDQIAYTVDENSGTQDGEIFSSAYAPGTRHVVVGTYDGNSYELYVDGTSEATGDNPPSTFSLGDLTIGDDAEGLDQHFEGEIYEIRLYYTAFDDEQVRVVSEAMS